MAVKGVSELIASVLILVVTISIAIIIFSFYTTTTKTATEDVGNKSSEAVECASASISIEDVYITNGTPGSARAIVRNSGLTDLTITSGQLYNRTGYNFSGSGIPLAGFSRGSVATISFENVTLKSCPADFSKIVVTTSCGGVSDVFDGTPRCT